MDRKKKIDLKNIPMVSGSYWWKLDPRIDETLDVSPLQQLVNLPEELRRDYDQEIIDHAVNQADIRYVEALRKHDSMMKPKVDTVLEIDIHPAPALLQ